jgi:hypothetical protein
MLLSCGRCNRKGVLALPEIAQRHGAGLPGWRVIAVSYEFGSLTYRTTLHLRSVSRRGPSLEVAKATQHFQKEYL